jgi:hypothetical protein
VINSMARSLLDTSTNYSTNPTNLTSPTKLTLLSLLTLQSLLARGLLGVSMAIFGEFGWPFPFYWKNMKNMLVNPHRHCKIQGDPLTLLLLAQSPPLMCLFWPFCCSVQHCHRPSVSETVSMHVVVSYTIACSPSSLPSSITNAAITNAVPCLSCPFWLFSCPSYLSSS